MCCGSFFIWFRHYVLRFYHYVLTFCHYVLRFPHYVLRFLCYIVSPLCAEVLPLCVEVSPLCDAVLFLAIRVYFRCQPLLPRTLSSLKTCLTSFFPYGPSACASKATRWRENRTLICQECLQSCILDIFLKTFNGKK